MLVLAAFFWVKRLQQLDWIITCIAHCVYVAARDHATSSRPVYHLSYRSFILYSCSIYSWCYDLRVSHSAIYIAKAERTALLDQPEAIRMAHHSNVESSSDSVSSTNTYLKQASACGRRPGHGPGEAKSKCNVRNP